ncbi:hypothetical protein LZ017_04840 [Pelomonas sp. CA6]|uniref:hypothetical protein n=1 Tax=Pelomonas sp. CA6 TaxID=2907999 RepID=UPI001F4A8E18|nr:hypothetical protein [Pelomonas sp. CA6]MCH7342704.1 hypothetical protein [Pelomonas sp. CA6]
MHQREAARAAWAEAGLLKTTDLKLRRFMREFETQTGDCWPQLAARVRSDYPEYLERLAAPLWKSGDTLLRVNLIRHADLARKDESELIQRWAATLDAERNRYELAAVVDQGGTELLDKVLKRKKLPDSLRLAAQQRRLQIEPP